MQGNKQIEQLVVELENLWAAYKEFHSNKTAHMDKIIENLEVDGEDAHRRWLAFKPPE
jgi:hypothetical protein